MTEKFNILGNTFQGPTAIGPGAQSTNSGSLRVNAESLSGNAFEKLAQALIRCGVPAAEIPKLREAIAADRPSESDSGNKVLGSAARNWIDRVVAKLADPASQIEIGMIGGMLATAIEKFYNFP